MESALDTLRREGVTAVAAEISSIGLAERRVDELSFRACVFTNLGRDHLDYHGTVENYFAAKLRLFSELLPRSAHPDAVAVVNGDDPYGRVVLANVRGAKISFGRGANHDARVIDATIGADGIGRRSGLRPALQTALAAARRDQFAQYSGRLRCVGGPGHRNGCGRGRVCGDAQGPPADWRRCRVRPA